MLLEIELKLMKKKKNTNWRVNRMRASEGMIKAIKQMTTYDCEVFHNWYIHTFDAYQTRSIDWMWCQIYRFTSPPPIFIYRKQRWSLFLEQTNDSTTKKCIDKCIDDRDCEKKSRWKQKMKRMKMRHKQFATFQICTS